MDVLRRGQRPSEIITKEALENAIAAVATSGGSTNGVLHLLAVAREVGVPLEIDEFDAHLRAHAAAVRPAAGRPLRRDRPLRGGRRPARAQAPAAKPGSCTRDALTVTGRTIGEHAAEAQRDARASGRAPAERPAQADRAASRSCAATSPPTAASSSSPATSAANTPAPRACSTARRRRWRPCSRKRSARATSS